MESKFPGWSPSPVSMASVQPAPEVRRRVGRLSTPRRATWHSPGAARKSLPARRSMIRVVSPAFSRAAAVRRVLRTPSDPSGVRAPVPRRGQQRHAAATPQPRRRGRPADRPGGGVQRLVQGPEPDPAAAQPGHDGDQGPAGTGTAGPGPGRRGCRRRGGSPGTRRARDGRRSCPAAYRRRSGCSRPRSGRGPGYRVSLSPRLIRFWSHPPATAGRARQGGLVPVPAGRRRAG
jgi:hypothetical protein